jgi:hypothetical protein
MLHRHANRLIQIIRLFLIFLLVLFNWSANWFLHVGSGIWGSLSFVSAIEELLGRKSSGYGLENREYGRKGSSCWPRNTLYRPKLALTSSRSSDRSVGIVRSRTKATEFVCFVWFRQWNMKFALSVHYSSALGHVK